jgi:hypothetical protein
MTLGIVEHVTDIHGLFYFENLAQIWHTTRVRGPARIGLLELLRREFGSRRGLHAGTDWGNTGRFFLDAVVCNQVLVPLHVTSTKVECHNYIYSTICMHSYHWASHSAPRTPVRLLLGDHISLCNALQAGSPACNASLPTTLLANLDGTSAPPTLHDPVCWTICRLYCYFPSTYPTAAHSSIATCCANTASAA